MCMLGLCGVLCFFSRLLPLPQAVRDDYPLRVERVYIRLYIDERFRPGTRLGFQGGYEQFVTNFCEISEIGAVQKNARLEDREKC